MTAAPGRQAPWCTTSSCRWCRCARPKNSGTVSTALAGRTPCIHHFMIKYGICAAHHLHAMRPTVVAQQMDTGRGHVS